MNKKNSNSRTEAKAQLDNTREGMKAKVHNCLAQTKSETTNTCINQNVPFVHNCT
jgi:hypothetical protein